jgi:CubicO group peptidase (beta-lactamase class C family)
MLVRKLVFSVLVILSFVHAPIHAQTSRSLPRSTPEAVGIPAAAIISFLDSIAVSKHEFHSFMVLRHGKVIAEGWWKPYDADLKHTLYSLSKSFTATAVGFAKAEGKLSLSDKVLSFFPDEKPDTLTAYLKQLTIKDLLTMSVGQEPDPTGAVVQDSNWVKRFLALPIEHEPGTTFLYNSMATYMLSAIVQKVTRQQVIAYLKPRLFQPLGITGMDWETDPKGINTGGWGLRLKTEDIAKFAQLFLQKGKWQGRQILPVGWVEEASTAKIIQHPSYSQAKRDSSDWEQGYGYQMWRCRNNAFRGDGAFGQYAIVMPEQDAVIAITSETADMQGELNLIWKVLLPAMHKGKLPANQKADAALQQKLASLALPILQPTADTVNSARLEGKTFMLEPNNQHFQSVAFGFQNQVCQLSIKTDTASYYLNFGLGDWQTGETTLHGPYLVREAKNSLGGLPPFKVAGAYKWLDGSTLELVLRYIESPHSETLLCHFDGDNVTLQIKRSFNAEATDAVITLKGVVQQ